MDGTKEEETDQNFPFFNSLDPSSKFQDLKMTTYLLKYVFENIQRDKVSFTIFT